MLAETGRGIDRRRSPRSVGSVDPTRVGSPEYDNCGTRVRHDRCVETLSLVTRRVRLGFPHPERCGRDKRRTLLSTVVGAGSDHDTPDNPWRFLGSRRPRRSLVSTSFWEHEGHG